MRLQHICFPVNFAKFLRTLLVAAFAKQTKKNEMQWKWKSSSFGTLEESMHKIPQVVTVDLGISFVVAISKLLSVEDCWSVDKFIGNSAIQNVMTRTRFKAIIQNLYFANNELQNTNDKYQLIFSTGYFQKVSEKVKTRVQMSRRTDSKGNQV